jgi:hypothetical protein
VRGELNRPPGFLALCGARNDGRYREAFFTLPVRMHRVQTFIRLTVWPTFVRMRCRFGNHRRLETLWAWLIRFPKTGALPQTSHVFAIVVLPQIIERGGF